MSGPVSDYQMLVIVWHIPISETSKGEQMLVMEVIKYWNPEPTEISGNQGRKYE